MKFIHIVEGGKYFIHFHCWIGFHCVYIYLSFLEAEGKLDCFQFRIIMKNATPFLFTCYVHLLFNMDEFLNMILNGEESSRRLQTV